MTSNRVNYTNIRSIFPYITIPRTEWTEGLAIEYAAQAYDLALGIKSATYDAKMCLVKVKNHKAKLPKGFRLIEMVAYMHDQPTDKEVLGFDESDTESNEITENPVTDSDYTFNADHITRIQNQGIVNNYNLYTGVWKHFFDVNYFTILRPMDDPFTRQHHCTWCPNLQSTCDYVYTINKQGELMTNIEEGYVCISYLSEPVDENGDLLIIDDADIQNALASYVMFKLWETKMHLHEENAINVRNIYLQQWEKLARKVKGKLNIQQLDSEAIAAYQHRFHHIVGNLSNWNGHRGILV